MQNNCLHLITPKIGVDMPKNGYGSNEFFNKVTTILKDKYSGEIASLQGDSVTLQHIKLQSLIMLEVLEEVRKISSVLTQKPTESPKTPITPGTASVSGKS